MDLIDLLIVVVECFFVGLGMELGAVAAKVVSVRILNGSSPVTVHDAEEEEEEEEEEDTRRKRRRRKAAGGASTPAAVRVM